MYIYKMVYAERKDFRDEEYNTLCEYDVIAETDYGTVEIMKDTVDYRKENKDVIKALNNGLGKEVTDALLKGTVDLVMIV